jgi:hypothetical protein
VSGHTAGKTTFCRFLRYALGERSFAADATRRRIRDAFSSGWLIAEIVVDDETWTVGRPLSVGPHSFSIRGGALEQATDGSERQEYGEFLAAVAAGALSATSFPTRDELLRWEHILSWLARDQECRFSDFLDWRHSSSNSEAAQLSVEERQFLVRSVLGLVSEGERAELQANAQLVAQRKASATQEQLLAHQAEVDHARVSSSLGRSLAKPSSPLFGSEARSELVRRTADVGRRESELIDSDRREELCEALERAVTAEANAKRTLTDTEQRLALEREECAQLAGERQASLLTSLPPGRDYCNVRLSVARDHGCPLAVSRPFEIATQRSERSAAQDLERLRQLVQSLEEHAAADRRVLSEASEATVAARTWFWAAGTAFESAKLELVRARAELALFRGRIEEAEEAQRAATEQAETVERLTREIDVSYTRQEQQRRERRDSAAYFATMFDFVVRAILGDESAGRVDVSGRSLSLVVEEHGERDSAAIATVKLLAFDLAALAASMEGHGTFPRLLIHDGPREADMAPEIYERLFLLARELEECCSGEPSFQYILTTTSPPPEACRQEPWLRLKLSGVPADGRFLRCDL